MRLAAILDPSAINPKSVCDNACDVERYLQVCQYVSLHLIITFYYVLCNIFMFNKRFII